MATLELFNLIEWYNQQTSPPSEEETTSQVLSHIDDGEAVIIADGPVAKIAFMLPKHTNTPNASAPVFVTVYGQTSLGGGDNPSVT